MFVVQKYFLYLLAFPLLLIFLTTYKLRDGIQTFNSMPEPAQLPESEPPEASEGDVEKPPEHAIPDHPIYKSVPAVPPPIVDNFPVAAVAHSADNLPPILGTVRQIHMYQKRHLYS
jgi:hypothetical protein